MNFEVTTSQLVVNPHSGVQSMKPYLYMVNAKSFGEAESYMLNYIEEKCRIGRVLKIEISTVSKVDKVNKKYFYKIKIISLEINDVSGKEQYVSHYHLISSDKPEDAIKIARRRFSDSDEYSIDQSIKRPFIDILNY